MRMHGAMHPSYLGRILLRWCDHCHVPVLEKQCYCGRATRAVPVTPPGDARPAFEADLDLINTIYSEHFGAPLVPFGHIALLNKVPDKDRMDEVIIGGGIAGAIRYIPNERQWEPIPRPEAGLLLIPKKRFVIVDDGAVTPIRDTGASVLAPGLVVIDDAVKCGDEVLILDKHRTCIGAGRARVDATSARTMKHGVIVKTRKNIASMIIPGTATWEDAVRANTAVIERTESAAVGFVQDIATRNGLHKNVSYSGGKDSLATFLVVTKALGKTPLLFADTGMEFPETYANIDTVTQHYGIDVVKTDGQTRFWEIFDRQGPPAVNARWCCKTCKLDPVQHLIHETWGECLSFIGQRKYESMRRARSKRIWKNPNVPAQTCAAPIHNWTALHVWLYLMRERAPYNILYERGLDRIGCFMCPSSDMALIRMIESKYPSLWSGWQKRLCQWQESHGLPRDWVFEGRWRLQGEDPVLEEDSDC
jgi:phosphoadenosine phosphosulfate reductase